MKTLLLFLVTSRLADLGFEDRLYRYASRPDVVYSDLNGYGHFLPAVTWFRVYWGAFAVLLMVLAYALWVRGRDGGFTYWPDGPDRPPRVHEGELFNTAILGDNDRMYHRVRPVGRRRDGMLGGMTLDARLEHDGGDAWAIRQNGATRASMEFSALRISVSWKAYVYRDTDQRQRHREEIGGLDLDQVVDRFDADLSARGIAFTPPADPLHDEAFVTLLTRAYVHEPTVFEA